jgi:anti-anti-sigma factor
MPAVEVIDLSHPALTSRTAHLFQPSNCDAARLTIRLLTPSPSVIAVTARGEIDASNAADLAHCALGVTRHYRGLVLDLRDLDFFGTAGLSALQTIDRWAPTAVRWAIVAGPEVSRLLRICDPDSSLPTAATVRAALTCLNGQPRRRLQLVATTR